MTMDAFSYFRGLSYFLGQEHLKQKRIVTPDFAGLETAREIAFSEGFIWSAEDQLIDK
ncbi:hypothetical protein V6C27_14215 [Peptococcaceae bacterium 1198_IL3148]